MSRDIGPDQNCQGSIYLGDSSIRAYDTGTSWTNLPQKVIDIKKAFTHPCRIEQLLEELPEMLQQLNSFEPLSTSTSQRRLARQALTAIKNRQKEDFTKLAKCLASDISGAVD
jgi:hypothetical protein